MKQLIKKNQRKNGNLRLQQSRISAKPKFQ